MEPDLHVDVAPVEQSVVDAALYQDLTQVGALSPLTGNVTYRHKGGNENSLLKATALGIPQGPTNGTLANAGWMDGHVDTMRYASRRQMFTFVRD